MAQPLEDAYCTLLMSDSYLPGAAVLAQSLRDAGTTKKLACIVTLETLSADTVSQLKTLYDYLVPVDRIRNPNPANLFLMGRPDLLYAFTKIALWRQTQFRKIVYLDADVVALRALDELFDIDAPFAAAPDIGWPDAFNTGVMVLKPDMGEYWALQTMAAAGDSFDGADQGLLNQYYEHKNWHRLSFTYNCTPNAQYQWEPAYRYYKRDISAVHFIGKDKPWSSRQSGAGGFGVFNELLARWWAVHDRHKDDVKDAPVSQSTSHTIHSEVSSSSERLLSEPGEKGQNIDQEQRSFSAPHMAWDATKFEPPSDAQPEAANFPTMTYSFSDSHKLFQAPRSYPEPPKGMWYQVPEAKPPPAEAPKPIFPWEREQDRPKATRVFAEDLPPAQTMPAPTHPFSTVHYDDTATPSSKEEAAPNFQDTSTNAWDTVPGIDDYVRAIMDNNARRGMTQVLHQSTEDVQSPVVGRKGRRESLILTDFPTAVERPSLPVTPAPVHRPSFWGEERDEQGELPPAEGVPDQADWNPEEKLEELRRLSVLEIEHLKSPNHPKPPLRALPEHSVPESETATHHHVHFNNQPAILGLDGQAAAGDPKPEKPLLQEPKFGAPRVNGDPADDAVTSARQDPLSPTET